MGKKQNENKATEKAKNLKSDLSIDFDVQTDSKWRCKEPKQTFGYLPKSIEYYTSGTSPTKSQQKKCTTFRQIRSHPSNTRRQYSRNSRNSICSVRRHF